MKTVKIGIIICDRYRNCGGGKCFRALQNREGAFDIYAKEDQVEIVGYANCGGCPGGNIEYVPEEMKKNGAEVIHLATGFVGTHPIPQKYIAIHSTLGTWETPELSDFIKPSLTSEKLRLLYD